jgi:hypothetical protein
MTLVSKKVEDHCCKKKLVESLLGNNLDTIKGI